MKKIPLKELKGFSFFLLNAKLFIKYTVFKYAYFDDFRFL